MGCWRLCEGLWILELEWLQEVARRFFCSPKGWFLYFSERVLMIRKFAVAALAVVALGFVFDAPAQAGGGGGKKTATIRVRNQAGRTLYALAQAGGLAVPTSYTGAQTIADGGVAAFKVAPGTGYIYAADNAAGAAPGVGAGQYVGTGSQTGYMNATQVGGLGTAITIAGSATAF